MKELILNIVRSSRVRSFLGAEGDIPGVPPIWSNADLIPLRSSFAPCLFRILPPSPPLPPPAPLYILGSLPSSLFPLPALHNCSQKQHGPFPSLAITRSLQNLKDTGIKSAIFPGILTFILQGQQFCFVNFIVAKMKVNHKYVLVLSKLCTFSLRGKTIFSALLSIAVLYARSAAGAKLFTQNFEPQSFEVALNF